MNSPPRGRSLLPPNATTSERAIEAATARLADIPVPIAELWNPHTCPEDKLAWLAWALGISAWKSYWPLAVKRARVASAIDIARRKGTAQSVFDVIASFGGSVVLTEWWQMDPAGIPYTFDMQLTVSGVDGEPASAAFVDDVIAEVSRTKPTRSHFTFTQTATLTGRLRVAVFIRPCIYARLNLYAEAATP
ncbi:phage tail protein I [Rhodanobacter sp. MP1X3]|uniref:phage tail protein I n=1 Tax=Rhodanobacter sp. MP1X3 TaxID=2723086 RepID=UPI0016098AC1|nr:phage tail protein I [Rhodanobacter sp. MP1X3]MBB6243660.1 phage tail P2-like protein [Rhodanobacter sp. MP1X3]